MDVGITNSLYQLEGASGVMESIDVTPLDGQEHQGDVREYGNIMYVNNYGGTQCQAVLHLSRRIWDSCLQTDTRLHLQYVAWTFNPADAPSRPDGIATRMANSYQILCPFGPQAGCLHGAYVRSSNQSPSPSLYDQQVRPNSPSGECHVDGLAIKWADYIFALHGI
jgi:hypothetical protein